MSSAASVAASQAKSLVEKIADAVLYEGYLLYPYRPSSVKNRQRWNFGALCPESYALAQRGTEHSLVQTECLLEADESTTVDIKVRFLHLLLRDDAWQQAVEREVVIPRFKISDLLSPYYVPFAFPGSADIKQQAIDGEVEISVTRSVELLVKVTIAIRNLTPFENA